MTPTNDAQQFADRADENRLQISADDATVIDGLGAVMEEAYLTIREIDTAGFEPAAIFVPTASGVRTGSGVRTAFGQRRRHAGAGRSHGRNPRCGPRGCQRILRRLTSAGGHRRRPGPIPFRKTSLRRGGGSRLGRVASLQTRSRQARGGLSISVRSMGNPDTALVIGPTF